MAGMKTKSSAEVELLSDVAKAFAESLDLEETLKSILKSLDTYLRLRRGTITLLDSQTETLRIRVAHGLSEKSKSLGSYKVGEGITGRVVQTGEEIVVPDISRDPRFLGKTQARESADGRRTAFFCVPIKLDGQTVGALSVDRQARRADDFEANVRLLNIIATMIAQAIKLNKLVESERKLLQDENVRLRRELKSRFDVHNMVGTSNAMQEVYRLVEQVAESTATVLIRGESGTGKDLVAHAVHYNSLRSEKPFIKVNCTAMPETLLESELFGYEKGAFTGAVTAKPGRFEMANGGTLFLDEIGDITAAVQVKLLRVLQERTFERLGGTRTIEVDVRVIAATNQDLQQLIADGEFREDLYYRLNVVPITLPPLRKRKGDIPLLVAHFMDKISAGDKRITPEAMQMLVDYQWPGNIRELENTIERIAILAHGPEITPEDLPAEVRVGVTSATGGSRCFVLPETGVDLEEVEMDLVRQALDRTGGSAPKAAKLLGLTTKTLEARMSKFGL